MHKAAIIILCVLVGSMSLAQCINPSSLIKIAIVIGNADYAYTENLTNPVNDANDMSDALRRLGFTVFRYTNLDLASMNTSIDSWIKLLDSCDVALFYYAGHAAELNKENFLFPTDCRPVRQPDLKTMAITFNRVLNNLSTSKARIRIALLDACRNNPFVRGFRGTNEVGLSRSSAIGSLVGLAASEGELAADGATRNGTYTAAILKYIETPDLSIGDMFVNITDDVVRETNGQQNPSTSTSLTSRFCFKTSSPPITANIDASIGFKVKNLLYRVKFNSSISDVIAFEYGEDQRNSIKYESLPVATECTNNLIKYYWVYFKESALRNRVIAFLSELGLQDAITSDSYFVYVFKENKLIRIDLRIFSANPHFYTEAMNKLSNSTDFGPEKYKSRVDEFYYMISSSVESGWKTVNISIANGSGFSACNNDWWTK